MKKPLYQQVISDLEKKIKTEMKPNDRLPSERQLLKEYGVSRNTIRLALNDLEERGVIYRLHGKGTFVACVNSGLLKEAREKEIQDDLERIIVKALQSGMSDGKIRDLVEIILQEIIQKRKRKAFLF